MANLSYWKQRFNQNGGHKTVGDLRWTDIDYANAISAFEYEIKSILTRKFDRCMDFGCGVGRWAGLLTSISKEYVPVDIIKYGENNVHIIDNGSINIPGKFDLIWTCTTLQHVTDDNELNSYIDQFKSLLEPNGRIICVENTSKNNNKNYIKYRDVEEYINLFLERNFSLHYSSIFYFGDEMHTIMEYSHG